MKEKAVDGEITADLVGAEMLQQELTVDEWKALATFLPFLNPLLNEELLTGKSSEERRHLALLAESAKTKFISIAKQ